MATELQDAVQPGARLRRGGTRPGTGSAGVNSCADGRHRRVWRCGPSMPSAPELGLLCTRWPGGARPRCPWPGASTPVRAVVHRPLARRTASARRTTSMTGCYFQVTPHTFDGILRGWRSLVVFSKSRLLSVLRDQFSHAEINLKYVWV